MSDRGADLSCGSSCKLPRGPRSSPYFTEKPESFVFIIFIPPRMPRVMERGSLEKRTRSELKAPFIGNKLRAYRRHRDKFKRKIDSTGGLSNLHKHRYMLTETSGGGGEGMKCVDRLEQLTKSSNIIC